MSQLHDCTQCGGDAVYIHVAACGIEPPEHIIICKNCRKETQIYEYSTEAVKEWNKKPPRER